MDAVVGVLAAVLGALVGVIGTWWVTTRQANREVAAKNREAAGAYLEAIAAALLGMASSFSSRTIPYEQGHTFQRLVDDYEPVLRPYMGDAVAVYLRKLQVIARRAEEHDGVIASGSDSGEATALLADIARMAGDLQAEAVKLRTKAF
jgi:hypothetical protein